MGWSPNPMKTLSSVAPMKVLNTAFPASNALYKGWNKLANPDAPPGSVEYDDARVRAIQNRMQGLQSKLDATPGPKMLGAEGPSYRARTPDQIPGLSGVKAGIANQYSAQAGTQMNALNRRFAAMGGGTSGALIKNQQQLLQDSADKTVDAQQAVDTQVLQQEAEREFGSQEAAKGRSLQREMYNSDIDFKDKVFRFDSSSKLAQIELMAVQAERDAQDQKFNKEMAQYQAKHQGGLLGSGGFLGLGI